MTMISSHLRRAALCFSLTLPAGLVATTVGNAQAISVNGGAIQGEITDASGAKLTGATVLITDPESGFSKSLVTDKSGFYSLGPLNPGTYFITISSPGFSTLKVDTVVRTGTATTGSFRLTVGSASETVEVAAGALQVNTEQAGVSDVITTEQIDSLPVNGRNFLDVAQIEPGVILQSGQGFDPTKAGYSAISVGGVSGRTTRILLDGQDITDEFVGTTIFNVSEGSISEFQLNRANQDVAGEVTSSGQVLVSTRTGTNAIHGMGFYNFQDARAAFASATPGAPVSPFQRNQFGGSVGGPLLRDKLFYFANYERIKQTQAAAAAFGTNFTSTYGVQYPTYSTPFKDNYSAGRLDYNGPLHGHYFVRGNDNINGAVAGTQFSLYNNRDNTWGIAGGADFGSGKFTHSFRGSYEKFHNFITDITIGSTNLFNPLPTVAINYATQNVHTGPNANAPQFTYQSDKQVRYDASYTRGAHLIRFGGSVNRILPGAFASFYGFAPRTNPTDSNLLTGKVTAANPMGLSCGGVVLAVPTSCPGDILNGYNTSSVTIANGAGFSSEIPGFNQSGGGGSSWRGAAYLADSWKASSNLTLTAGIRYSVDTNRQNNDLAPPPCSSLSTQVSAACAGLAPTTSIFTLFGAPSGSVKTPYKNFAPQVGLVFSPGNHKTAIRAGFGIFFESDVFNNASNARSGLLATGNFYGSKAVCSNYTVTFPDGSVVNGVNTSGAVTTTAANSPTPAGAVSLQNLCQNRTITQSAPYFAALQNTFHAATAATVGIHSTYVGNTLSASGLYYPAYKQPYSEQWNFGVQREVFKGGILSADYVHNTALRVGQTLDINHQGAARTFNTANAQAAVTATIAACKGSSVAGIIQTGGCQGLHAGAAGSGATLADFATRGLDSGGVYAGGTNYLYAGKANGGAFPGLNQNLGSGAFIQPIGRSGYDALQVVFRGQKSHPAPFVDSGNLQISYNLSRIVGTGGTSDQFFSNGVYDKDNPTQYIGRLPSDRKHQVNVGGSFRFKYGPQLGIIAHFYSAVPTTLTLDTAATSGGIFQTDITGDGTTGDIAPGTKQGAYMHDIKSDTLQSYITNFNSTYAGQLTPAGRAVVGSGLFTQAQLTQIGGAIQTVANLPQATALNNPAFRNMDVNFSYPLHLKRLREGLALTPGVAFYNVGNFSNFSSFGGVLYNVNTAGGATYNGTSGITGQNNFAAESSGHRTLRGSGTFDQGVARSAEFTLKLDF